MYLSETHAAKWGPVLDHPDLPKINDNYKRAVTAVVLENQERAIMEESQNVQKLFEATPVNVAPTSPTSGNLQGFDPILIGLVRRALPNLMAYDICGVQPMTGPTGLIFAMRTRYGAPNGTEAFYNEANTTFSGDTTAALTANVPPLLSGVAGTGNLAAILLANVGAPVSTATGETLGLANMAFSIERVSVTAKTRGLQASYTLELAQDLKAIHGLDAETELTNILSTEILAEINREVVRTVYATANVGVLGVSSPVLNLANAATAAEGVSGRWQVEKYKGLLFQIEKACNKIAKDTRRGKGNMLIVSTDVASALAMTGLLDYNSALSNNTNLTVDDTGNTFAGTLFGRLKVYVDPYSVTGYDYCVVGYKGTNPYDAGMFYCPYVPLQMVRAIDPDNYQPKVGFKTRYGMVQNPFADGSAAAGTGTISNGTNVYYRKFAITNINAI
jgi:Major capsid protein Gp23